jgi:hypothetical protein
MLRVGSVNDENSPLTPNYTLLAEKQDEALDGPEVPEEDPPIQRPFSKGKCTERLLFLLRPSRTGLHNIVPPQPFPASLWLMDNLFTFLAELLVLIAISIWTGYAKYTKSYLNGKLVGAFVCYE